LTREKETQTERQREEERAEREEEEGEKHREFQKVHNHHPSIKNPVLKSHTEKQAEPTIKSYVDQHVSSVGLFAFLCHVFNLFHSFFM